MNRYIPTIKFSCLCSSFWMSFCIVFNYAAMYLLSVGYSSSQIGVIIAVCGLISAMLQPVIAGVADRGSAGTIRRLILALAVFMILCAAVLMVPGLHFLFHALFYGLLVAVLQMLTPLVNAVGMECINHGISVNFGLARGIGSVSFAFASFIAGTVIERFSTTVIPVLIIFCYLLVLLAACAFCFHYKAEAGAETAVPCAEGGNGSFFASYKKFTVLLIGISFLFVCHNMLNNFMFQVMTYHHGGSREMGIAAGISASLELPTMILFSLMIKRISSGNLLKISGVFFVLKAFFTFVATGIGGVYGAQTAQMFGFALFTPASVYYTNSLIRPSDRAKGQAFMTATNTIGSVFGSLLGGFLIDGPGLPAMLLTSVIFAVIGAVLVFLSVERCIDTV